MQPYRCYIIVRMRMVDERKKLDILAHMQVNECVMFMSPTTSIFCNANHPNIYTTNQQQKNLYNTKYLKVHNINYHIETVTSHFLHPKTPVLIAFENANKGFLYPCFIHLYPPLEMENMKFLQSPQKQRVGMDIEVSTTIMVQTFSKWYCPCTWRNHVSTFYILLITGQIGYNCCLYKHLFEMLQINPIHCIWIRNEKFEKN